jgi:imidazole glycerol-phosphate synthase subunit HisH
MVEAIDVVEIGAGNIGSVKRCLEMLDIRYQVVNYSNPPTGNSPLLLPGVGAFGPVMDHLRKDRFDERLVDLVRNGTPYLGICIGMQILFDSSEEAKNTKGLGLVSGVVRKFQEGKVPQIGWNNIEISPSPNGNNTGQFPEAGYVYFVNSYYPDPSLKESVLYYADYFVRFCAAVAHKNITAFQFHPEKSGKFGKELLKRWIDSVT